MVYLRYVVRKIAIVIVKVKLLGADLLERPFCPQNQNLRIYRV